MANPRHILQIEEGRNTYVYKRNGMSFFFFLFTGSILFLIHYKTAAGQSHENVETTP